MEELLKNPWVPPIVVVAGALYAGVLAPGYACPTFLTSMPIPAKPT